MEGRVINGDALTDDALSLKPADLILANPPFGSTGGGARARREDLAITTSNKQLLFLQHIYRSLKPGGRAAVVVPDNVLFETGAGRRVRQELFETCDVHTILRLPVGIFYATGVSTVVLMFTRWASTDRPVEDRMWVYDLRGTAQRYGRGVPFDAAIRQSQLNDARRFHVRPYRLSIGIYKSIAKKAPPARTAGEQKSLKDIADELIEASRSTSPFSATIRALLQAEGLPQFIVRDELS
jgi:SAM-dependent methyltransferase